MYLSFEAQWVVTVNKYNTHGIRSLSLGYFLIYCLLTPNFLDAVPWGEAGLGGGASPCPTGQYRFLPENTLFQLIFLCSAHFV